MPSIDVEPQANPGQEASVRSSGPALRNPMRPDVTSTDDLLIEALRLIAFTALASWRKPLPDGHRQCNAERLGSILRRMLRVIDDQDGLWRFGLFEAQSKLLR